jgi:peptidylprolyl isomerase
MSQQYSNPPTMAIDPSKKYTATFKTSRGEIVCELHAKDAPKTVNNFVFLAKEKFYDGTVFHRVIPDFMVQGGDPTGTGAGGTGQHLKAEFSAEHHVRGVVSMARSGSPDSADCQFFIMLGDNSSLDGKYTIWGQVVSGMEFVDMIKKGDDDPNGMVTPPQDKIIKMQVAADVKE